MDPQQIIGSAMERLDEDRWQDPRVEPVFDPETFELRFKLEAYGDVDMNDVHLKATLDWKGDLQTAWVGDGFRDVWMFLPIDGSGEWVTPDPHDADALFGEWLRQIVSEHKADKEAS